MENNPMSSSGEGYQPFAHSSPNLGHTLYLYAPYPPYPPFLPPPPLYPTDPIYPAYPQPPFGASYPYYQGPVAPSTNGLAIASLVVSIGGLLLLGIVGSILGIIFGHAAQSQIKRAIIPENGWSLATAGLIVGYIGLAYNILLIAAWIFFLVIFPALISTNIGAM